MTSILARIILCSFLFLLFIPQLTSAETKTFIKEYTYQASEADSKQTCRILALEQVKRLLLEEIGTYLESETVVKNFQLTHDQIKTFTAGVVKTEIVTEKWDGKEYQLKAKISADPDSVASAIDNLRGNQQKVKELEEAKKKIDETIKEVDQLRKELTALKSAAKRKSKINQYNSAVKNINLTDLYSKARLASYECMYSSRDRCQSVIEAFKKIIELDTGNADAYYECGTSYYAWGKYKEAIEMFNMTLKKGTANRDYVGIGYRGEKNENVYSQRGDAYFDLSNYSAAISDFSKAIALRPYYSRGSVNDYRRRGESYLQLKEYRKAIDEFDEAIKVASNDDTYREEEQPWWSDELKADRKNVAVYTPKMDLLMSYRAKGRAYGILGNREQAIIEYTKALEFFPDSSLNAYTYYLRSLNYSVIKNHEQAIKDISKAIDLNPKEPDYYYQRANICDAFVLLKLSEVITTIKSGASPNSTELQQWIEQSKKDYQTAARLGHSAAQESLKSRGITW